MLVNSFRADYHVPPVRHLSSLDRTATTKILKIQQCGKITHYPCGKFGYSTCQQRAEVIAWGYNEPENAVNGWKNSPPHRKILLGRNYVLIGGAVTSTLRWGKVWILEFGRNC